MKANLILVMALVAAPVAGQNLRDLALQRGIRIGTAADGSYFSESSYNTLLGQHFNQLEPENVMKFGPIHPGIGTYNFVAGDQLVSYAISHDMAVRGHTLVWHSQNPAWLTNGGYSSSQLATILHDHINAVVGHYAGKLYAWDVVNEAFNDDGSLRSTIWSDSPGIGLAGTAYIEQAFRWAHDADPKALLFYNDYSNASISAKSTAIYNMVKDFLARGVPINGVGLQMHLTNVNTDLSGIEPNIKRLTDLGIQVQYTEFDVRLPVDSSGNATAGMLATEAQIYGDAMTICLKYRLCTAFQSWGFTDKHSWIPGTYPGFGAALEFDQNYQPKPAVNFMISSMRNSPPVLVNGGMTNSASYANAAVAPGEIVTLFGGTFGPSDLTLAALDVNSNLPVKLNEVRVLFDGTPAPLIYAKVNLVSAVVPFAVAGKTTTQVVYEYQGLQSNPITVNVVPAVPGIFTLNSQGTGPGAILDLSYKLISASNPAHRGDFIQVYATGAGVTSPGSIDGHASATGPFGSVSNVTAKIGGVPCTVVYAGGASGLVAGAVQVNIQIANNVPLGDQPVVISVGGADSQTGATVLIQ